MNGDVLNKALAILKELKVPIIGVIENMKMTNSPLVREQVKPFNIPYLGEIRFDAHLEDSIGDADKLLKTEFMSDMRAVVLNTPEFRLGKAL